MKTLGLIGGMSWNSTELYYRYINQAVANELGALHSAKILLHSFDFAEIAALQKNKDWPAASARMVEAAQTLKAAGADALVICTNTMHLFAADIERVTGMPVLHIGDAVAHALKARGITRAGILGTYLTMSMGFYADYYRERHGITLLAPDEADMQTISRIIYDELCQGKVNPTSRAQYIEIMHRLEGMGAQAIILGCTEICLLIEPGHYPGLPLLDSTRLHADLASDFALNSLKSRAVA